MGIHILEYSFICLVIYVLAERFFELVSKHYINL